MNLSLRLRLPIVALSLAVLAGCAMGPERHDPFEPFNRKVSSFNDELDKVALKPLATAYRDAVPPMGRTGVSNFFGNLSDGWSALNSLLQLKFQYAADNILRLSVNTVFGLVGVLDIASEMGVERHREDFGQTLGHWGVPAGPYLVLPLLGPSTVRDTAALPVDYQGDPIHFARREAETGLYVLRVVNVRANLLRAGDVLDQVALDKYSFTRDAYLQKRRAEIFETPSDAAGGKDGAARNPDSGGDGFIPPEPADESPMGPPGQAAPQAQPGPGQPPQPAQPGAPAR